MKNILLFLIPIILGISQVSAETGTTNVAPVAIDDVATTNEDVSVTINVLTNDTDANGDALSVTSVYNVNNGVAVNGVGTGVVFTPTAYFYGTGSFEYVLSDGTLTDTGKVLITVNTVNNGPVAVNDTFTVDVNSTTTLNLVANDTDIDSNNLQVVSIGTILNGTGTITASGVVFKPNTNFEGVISFDYVVSDGTLTDNGTVMVNVTNINKPPLAVNDVVSVIKNTSTPINLIANDTDPDGDSLHVVSIGTILNGTGTVTTSGVVFTPNNDFEGVVSFEYVVSDGSLTDTGMVLVSVNEKNFVPIAVVDSLITQVNTSKTIDPRSNDIDKDKDVLAIISVTQPSHGSVTFTSVSVTYIPTTNYRGSDMFKYTVSDGNGGTATGQINVSVKERYDDDDDDDDDNGNDSHVVQSIQKEYIAKFKELKAEYKNLKNKELRREYLAKKKELRAEYLQKLKSVTGTEKKYNYEGDSVKANYKAMYNSKYGVKISQMTNQELQVIIGRIDTLLNQVNNSTSYSSDTKQKFTTMLMALKELLQDSIDSDELDIDSLFE